MGTSSLCVSPVEHLKLEPSQAVEKPHCLVAWIRLLFLLRGLVFFVSAIVFSFNFLIGSNKSAFFSHLSLMNSANEMMSLIQDLNLVSSSYFVWILWQGQWSNMPSLGSFEWVTTEILQYQSAQISRTSRNGGNAEKATFWYGSE